MHAVDVQFSNPARESRQRGDQSRRAGVVREDVDDRGGRHDLEPGKARGEPRRELEGVEAEGDGEQADRVVDCARQGRRLEESALARDG